MATSTIDAQADRKPHVCRFLRQHPDAAHVARCAQCGAEYRIELLHEMAHACLIDLAGSEPGACQRCGSVYHATAVEATG